MKLVAKYGKYLYLQAGKSGNPQAKKEEAGDQWPRLI